MPGSRGGSQWIATLPPFFIQYSAINVPDIAFIDRRYQFLASGKYIDSANWRRAINKKAYIKNYTGLALT
jgi:hypothetical protein